MSGPAVEANARPAGPGFYGKLPAKGDFVTRRLARAFVDPWDAWLQEVISDSRERLGEAWLQAYLNAPIWCFVLSPGVCGTDVMAGVLMPGVDRVGRYFPLTLAVALPDCANPVALALAAADWFGDAGELALSSLDDGVDFERFDAMVEDLGPPRYAPAPAPAPVNAKPTTTPFPDQGLRCGAAVPAEALPPIANHLLAGFCPRFSIWWTSGSAFVEPSVLICQGLPKRDEFAAFMDGRWRDRGWIDTAKPGQA